jgi:diamine N-acetyltransferase
VSTVPLREIAQSNLEPVLALSIAPTQKRFVGSAADALRDVDEIPHAKPWDRAVYADDEPVGFVLSGNVTPEPPRIIGPWSLWKLLVDERHQGQGTVARPSDSSLGGLRERRRRAADELCRGG